METQGLWLIIAVLLGILAISAIGSRMRTSSLELDVSAPFRPGGHGGPWHPSRPHPYGPGPQGHDPHEPSGHRPAHYPHHGPPHPHHGPPHPHHKPTHPQPHPHHKPTHPRRRHGGSDPGDVEGFAAGIAGATPCNVFPQQYSYNSSGSGLACSRV